MKILLKRGILILFMENQEITSSQEITMDSQGIRIIGEKYLSTIYNLGKKLLINDESLEAREDEELKTVLDKAVNAILNEFAKNKTDSFVCFLDVVDENSKKRVTDEFNVFFGQEIQEFERSMDRGKRNIEEGLLKNGNIVKKIAEPKMCRFFSRWVKSFFEERGKNPMRTSEQIREEVSFYERFFKFQKAYYQADLDINGVRSEPENDNPSENKTFVDKIRNKFGKNNENPLGIPLISPDEEVPITREQRQKELDEFLNKGEPYVITLIGKYIETDDLKEKLRLVVKMLFVEYDLGSVREDIFINPYHGIPDWLERLQCLIGS